jgi:hypothetical protein
MWRGIWILYSEFDGQTLVSKHGQSNYASRFSRNKNFLNFTTHTNIKIYVINIIRFIVKYIFIVNILRVQMFIIFFYKSNQFK